MREELSISRVQNCISGSKKVRQNEIRDKNYNVKLIQQSI